MKPIFLPRRRFVTGFAGLAAGFAPGLGRMARAAPNTSNGNVPQAARTAWHLAIERRRMTIDGKTLDAACANGTVPGPILRFREGDDISLTVENRMTETTSIHWHGLRVPAAMDGVPGLSFAGIPAGESFTYRFPVRQSGTYWYHSHSGMQEAQGLYGAIVIDPRTPDPVQYDRDYVLVLSEWTDVPPHDIVSNLKMQDDYYVFRQRTLASLPAQAKTDGGMGAALRSRLDWSGMNMAATDIADVTGIIYTYTANGCAPDANWTALFRPHERVRLRIINASTMTLFDVRIPGLAMQVVQADGQNVHPVEVDEFRIGVAETYDVIVQPKEDRAYTIFAQSEDRTGYARATLSTQAGLAGPIPPMDPRPVRSMVDMGMAMGGMSMSGMGNMKGMNMPTPAPEIDDPGPPPIDVENQNVAMMPTDRLSSPGDGLEHNGRRVLSYAMLRALTPSTDQRPPSREIILHLTGNMERYIWGFNGRKFSESGPIRLKLGERVRFTLINDTMMEHPIHLHGLWSELENGHGADRPVKHTIIAQPGSRLSYLVSADTPGLWAYHCHLLYHMDLGMFRTVIVS